MMADFRRHDLVIGAVMCRACGRRYVVPIERMSDFLGRFAWMMCPYCREVTRHEEVML